MPFLRTLWAVVILNLSLILSPVQADELDDFFNAELVEPLYELALPLARTGNAKAQMYLGVLYWDERFSENDPDLAMLWLQIAFANGQTDAASYIDPLLPYFTPRQLRHIAEVAAQCIDSSYENCTP